MVALPNILDLMYWIGPQGLFASAVLPTILAIVFVETGLLFPLLPGESLLFTGGLLAAHGTLDIWVLAPAVALTAILGDQTGYFIGRRIGPALFKKEDSRFFKQHHVTESHAFFEKYGPAAIILARFMPFVRTFTPVVAGVSYMRYPVYLAFDVVGGILADRDIRIRWLGYLQQERLHRRPGGFGAFFGLFDFGLQLRDAGDRRLLLCRVFQGPNFF